MRFLVAELPPRRNVPPDTTREIAVIDRGVEGSEARRWGVSIVLAVCFSRPTAEEIQKALETALPPDPDPEPF